MTGMSDGPEGEPGPRIDRSMPEYLATVRCPNGRKVTENVIADSADEAVMSLRERGCDEIVLHNDDVTALYTRQREQAALLSPRDYLQFRNVSSGLGLMVVVTLQCYRRWWAAMVIAAVTLAMVRIVGSPWSAWDLLSVFILSFPLALAILTVLLHGGIHARYRKALDALYWGRWEEALWRSDRLGVRIQPHEIALRKAQALAGMDRLPEALKLLEPFGDGKAVPGWFYRSILAQVYEIAHRRDEAIAQVEQAIERAPDNSTMYLTLARHVIWYQGDVRRARELLTQARKHALSDLTVPYADMIEGLILHSEGRSRDALPILESAYKAFRAHRHMPLGYLPMEQAMLGLALTYAALGESDQALKLYGKVRPRLVALRSGILEKCDREIGLP
jgi:tetratricopeptide (TPR) repeat protein